MKLFDGWTKEEIAAWLEKHGGDGDCMAMSPEIYAESQKALDELAKTAEWDEHPEGYDGPCMCRLCASYCNDGVADEVNESTQ